MISPPPADRGPLVTRRAPDPWRLASWSWEEERDRARDEPQPTLTLFLVGARCPFSCLFCDLDHQTISTATPPGAIPEQIRQGLAAAGPVPAGAAVKLYNASNFFDQRAVPAEDEEEIAALLTSFERVTVECHPRLVGERCFRFAGRLDGALEVAMGLETVAPQAFPRLRKGMALDDFAHAAAALRRQGIAVRAFVLLSPPFVPADEAVDWAVRSVRFAVDTGAERVAVIPTRTTPELERLAARGEFTAPTLRQLEEAIDRTLQISGAEIAADLWDAARLFALDPCVEQRIARLRRLAITGRSEPRHHCATCAADSEVGTDRCES